MEWIDDGAFFILCTTAHVQLMLVKGERRRREGSLH